MDPGWVPTKMGGAGAPDDLEMGHLTQTWLATSDTGAAKGALSIGVIGSSKRPSRG